MSGVHDQIQEQNVAGGNIELFSGSWVDPGDPAAVGISEELAAKNGRAVGDEMTFT